jgi:c-di-GMP-binding flagellar brake protein YcgR
MADKERRRYPRLESLNLIAYACIDGNGNVISQGMGRTLNVSQMGLLLETYFPLDCEDVMLLGVGIRDELIDIRGRVVHVSVNNEGKYASGIEFIEIDKRSSEILTQYIDAFFKSEAKL